MEKFWMLFAEHGQAPRVQHMTHGEAAKEAERILRANKVAGKQNGVVFVFEAVSAVSVLPTPIPVVWERLEEV